MSQFNIDDPVVFKNVKYTIHSQLTPDTVLLTLGDLETFLPAKVTELEPYVEKKEMTIEERNAIILEWIKTESEAAQFKDRENELRKEIVENFFSAKKLKGTENLKLDPDGNYKLKCVKTINTSVENDPEKLSAIVAQMPEGFADIFKWKPSLNETLYKELSDEHKKLVDVVLTTKPGIPSLKFIQPKVEG